MQEKLEDKIAALELALKAQNEAFAKINDKLTRLHLSIIAPRKYSQSLTAEEDFEALKMLLNSPVWPCATDPILICDENSQKQKENRADSILDILVDMPLEGKRFLDFGCGEGHVVHQALVQKPKVSVGYDIAKNLAWEQFQDGEIFTDNWQEVKESGPYNTILIYDVIDHIIDDHTRIDTLTKLRGIMAPSCRVYVRVHPWCSRHGTHLYQKINKAFVHLVLKPEELKVLGLEGVPTHKVIHPMVYYEEIFKQTKFKILRKQVVNDRVEHFFCDIPLVAHRIKSHWGKSFDTNLRIGKVFPTKQMQQQFIDYILL